jgi:cytochrome c
MKKMNPCAAKAANPCAASGHVDPALITRPADYRPYQGKQAALVKEGKKLFSDTKLSSNGMSCSTCHANYGAFQESFAQPYPHHVQMVDGRTGKKTIELDEMVQLCMVVPMAAKPLPWDSKELAALTAYTAELQKGFKPGKAAAMGNPCAMKHNPCAMKKH